MVCLRGCGEETEQLRGDGCRKAKGPKKLEKREERAEVSDGDHLISCIPHLRFVFVLCGLPSNFSSSSTRCLKAVSCCCLLLLAPPRQVWQPSKSFVPLTAAPFLILSICQNCKLPRALLTTFVFIFPDQSSLNWFIIFQNTRNPASS